MNLTPDQALPAMMLALNLPAGADASSLASCDPLDHQVLASYEDVVHALGALDTNRTGTFTSHYFIVYKRNPNPPPHPLSPLFIELSYHLLHNPYNLISQNVLVKWFYKVISSTKSS